MKPQSIIILILTVALCAVSAVLFFKINQTKNAFLFNQKVFEAFKGKQELEKKFELIKKSNRHKLDSIANRMIAIGMIIPNSEYENIMETYQLQEQQLLGKYTADVWSQINQYVGDYGKEGGYDFIYGAVGNGSLMFANGSKDVTEEVIKYINQRYEGNH